MLLLFGVGCVNEYHPEYHPVTSYTYVENVSYPTVVIQTAAAPPVAGLTPRRIEATKAAPSAREGALADAARGVPPPIARSMESAPDPKSRRAGQRGAGPGEPLRVTLPHVVTRLRLADAMKLKRNRYARFEVHATSDSESRQSEIKPLDNWWGERFDVRPDPSNPALALVRFDVWNHPGVSPGASVVVTTNTWGGEPGSVFLSYGRLEGDEEEDRRTNETAVASAVAP
jgi:hypothetical protein